MCIHVVLTYLVYKRERREGESTDACTARSHVNHNYRKEQYHGAMQTTKAINMHGATQTTNTMKTTKTRREIEIEVKLEPEHRPRLLTMFELLGFQPTLGVVKRRAERRIFRCCIERSCEGFSINVVWDLVVRSNQSG